MFWCVMSEACRDWAGDKPAADQLTQLITTAVSNALCRQEAAKLQPLPPDDLA